MTSSIQLLKKWTTNFMNFDNQLIASEKGVAERIPTVGDIFDHPNYTDGETIHTSYVTDVEISEQKIRITTVSVLNTILDEPYLLFH